MQRWLGSELRGSFVSSACQKACSISSVPQRQRWDRPRQLTSPANADLKLSWRIHIVLLASLLPIVSVGDGHAKRFANRSGKEGPSRSTVLLTERRDRPRRLRRYAGLWFLPALIHSQSKLQFSEYQGAPLGQCSRAITRQPASPRSQSNACSRHRTFRQRRDE